MVRMLWLVARAVRRCGIPVSVCGEMAADPIVLTLLVGLGLTEFSMAPTAVALAKQALRGLSAAGATQMAARALRARTASEVEKVLAEFMSTRMKVGPRL